MVPSEEDMDGLFDKWGSYNAVRAAITGPEKVLGAQGVLMG